MPQIRVQSSNIFSVGYNAETRTATVTFHKDGAPTGTYEYENVDPLSMCELVFADSIGSHFARNFKPRFTLCHKVVKAAEAEQVVD